MKKQLLSFLIVSLMLVMAVSAVSAASIWTDKADYAPDETVLISGEGFEPNSELSVDLTRPDEAVQSCDSESCHERFLNGVLIADENGEFSNYPYKLNGVYGEYSIEISDGENTASTTFTDWIAINWVRLNGASQTTVYGGDSITVTISANTWGVYNNWMSSAYRIEGQDWVCVDTPNHYSSGTKQESFVISAPSNEGTYDVEFAVFTYDLCLGLWGYESKHNGITVLDVDDEAPVVSNIQHAPTYPTCGQDVEVCLDVTDESDIDLVRMNWNSPMSPARGGYVDFVLKTGNTYCGILSSTSTDAKDGRTVTYNFYVEDEFENHNDITGSSYTYDCADPTADADGSYSCSEGSSVELDASGSSDSVDTELDYAWDFDNDGIYDDATGAKPMFACLDDMVDYPIAVQVTDNVGRTDTDSSTVTVTNVNPVADANGPYTVNEGNSVELTGSATDEGTLDTHTFAWDLDNNGVYESSGQSTLFRCYQDGVYTVGLKVTDDDAGEGYDTATISCKNVAPSVNHIAVSPDSIFEEESTTLTATVSDPGADDTTLSYTISWGDGSTDTTGSTSNGQISETHQYMDDDDNDQYTVTLTVTDSDGATDSDSMIIGVLNKNPWNVDAGENQNAVEGEMVYFNGLATDVAADQGSLVYHWDFGNGGSATSGAPSAGTTYSERGTYTVTLTVTDKDGGSETDTLTVNVYDYKIHLSAGWNLISIPLVPIGDDTSIDNVFSQIDEDVRAVWSYTYDLEQGKNVWRYNEFEDGWDSDESKVQSIIPGYGYYVLMNEAATIYLNGELTYSNPSNLPEVELEMDNWNLIGGYGLQTLPVSFALETLIYRDPYYDIIYGENDNGNLFIPEEILPTKGYWLSIKKVFGGQDRIGYRANYLIST